MSATAFLLYRPVMDYEESIEPNLIFTTRTRAQKAKRAIVEAATALIDSFPEWPDGCDSFAQRVETEVWQQRADMVRDFVAPFGWDLKNDISAEDERFGVSCIDIMELPLNPPATPAEGKAAL